jgi:hypothetical protein
MIELREHQEEAIRNLDSGKILWGGVGIGKSATVLGYYMRKEAPRHIYVITTAKKRDSLDWEREASMFGIGTEDYCTVAGILTVDSWNKIGEYEDVEDAFFIFDEQRVVGHGAWVKSFLKITKKNRWVLLSATPGDTWLDYAPVFIANGFYPNITQFKLQHVVYEPFSKFPKVRLYLNTHVLEELRNHVLVEMPYDTGEKREINWLCVGHDKEQFKEVQQDRWNALEDRPIKDVAEMFRLMRRVVNSDPSRIEMVKWVMKLHPKLIVFYNFNYELEALRTLRHYTTVAELNGHKKEAIPEDDRWVYLVQYVAGAEAWNCTETNAMVMYSLTYSYKNFEQAMGRIDRLDTPFETLYYYIFVSNSVIDRAIKRSLTQKKSFNERKFASEMEEFEGYEEDRLELCETVS